MFYVNLKKKRIKVANFFGYKCLHSIHLQWSCPPQSLPTNPTPHHALTLFVATELDCKLPFPEVEPFPSWWQCKKHFNQITYQPRLKHEYCVTRFLAGAAIATSLVAGGVTVDGVNWGCHFRD